MYNNIMSRDDFQHLTFGEVILALGIIADIMQHIPHAKRLLRIRQYYFIA